jgi:hypothetical protein
LRAFKELDAFAHETSLTTADVSDALRAVQITRFGSGERRSPTLGTTWLLYEGADANTGARRALVMREPP